MSVSRSGEKLKGLALAAAVAVALLATTFSAPALAGVEGNQSAFASAGTDELANKTVAVGNDTQSVYVELDDTSDGENATGNVNATIYEVDESGNETQADKVQLQPDDDSEAELYEYSSLNTSMDYRVLVEGNSTDSPNSSVSVGTIEKIAGSGGGGSLTSGSGLDMTLAGIPVVLLVGAGALLLIGRSD